MNRKWFWLTLTVAFSLILLSLLLFLGTRKKPGEGRDLPSDRAERVAPGENRVVQLYYLKETSTLYHPVKRELQIPQVAVQQYKVFIDLLIKGAEGYIVPIPENLVLIQAYLIPQNGSLVLDFQEDVLNHLPPGTDAEKEFIYFFVNNICANFAEVKRVVILFGGNQHQTLSGHLDVERAYCPDFSQLAKD